MKKILLLMLLLAMFIPSVVYAETCDQDKISISSITIENSSNNVTEIEQATANGKNINVNLSMSEVGDNIIYKVVVKNESNEDYELNKNSLKVSSEYVDYVLESEDNSNIVKANSSKVVYLKVNYANEVSEDKFESGTYSDNKMMTLSLETKDTVPIPNTFKSANSRIYSLILILVGITLIVTTIYGSLKKKKYVKPLIIIIGVSIIIPISVSAICKCDISINSNVVFTRARMFSGVIYRSSNTTLSNGDTINPNLIQCDEEDICYYIDEKEYNTKQFSIKHDIVNNVIMNSYACDNRVCIKGGRNSNFEENTQVFTSLYSNNTVEENRIYNRGNHNYIEQSGNVRIGSYCGYCIVQEDDSSMCYSLDVVAC